MNFEEKLKELEIISQKMSTGDSSLDESMKSFEEGMKLAKELEKELENYEQKVKILMESTTGETHLEDFE